MDYKTNRLPVTLVFLFLMWAGEEVMAQSRIVQTINSNWLFFQGEQQNPSFGASKNWKKLSLPHTWNSADVMDDEPGYYRGTGFYTRNFHVPESWKNKEIYIHFEAVAQEAEIWVNNKFVGEHTGGYGAFRFRVTHFLNFSATGLQQLKVKVSNKHHEDIPPLSGDFTFFGGIYRDVKLIVTEKVHFDLDNYASSGLFIRTPEVSTHQASILISGKIKNHGSTSRQIKLNHLLFNETGTKVTSATFLLSLKAGEEKTIEHKLPYLKNPQLWSTSKPVLYRLISRIEDSDNKILMDEISNPVGFRWYSFSPDSGFYLNGEPLKLIGANRHQDYKNLGNALPDELHTRDVELLKEMGGNFLRVAHYPQDPSVLQACDKLGILASVEIPIVNRITESTAFADNSKEMLVEMIRQHFNHPSVIIWAYMNEVLLRPRYENGSREREEYLNAVTKLAEELEFIIRKEDTERYSLIPNHGNFDLYKKTGLTRIPKLVGWNLYQGWYSGDLDGFARYLDRHKKELPNKPLLVTEYGADADARLHSFSPVRFDKTIEYTNEYHKVYLKAMLDRPFVAAAMIWNLAEFNSETRGETTPHINAKGILTHDRKPKDVYYFYQAHLLKQPYVRIASRGWITRAGIADSGKEYCTQPVEVYSNQEWVTLIHNGKELGAQKTDFGSAAFNVAFIEGVNKIEVLAPDGGLVCRDEVDILFSVIPKNTAGYAFPFKTLRMSLGDKRFFTDELSSSVWLPEMPYQRGSWGFLGGKAFTLENSARQPYGTDKDILGTPLDPVYATQRIGIEGFKFDIPNGKYELTLHFAELLSAAQKEELIYNLGNDAQQQQFSEREFTVYINDQPVLERVNNATELIPERAISARFTINVWDNNGILIKFKALKGETILNGIELKQVF